MLSSSSVIGFVVEFETKSDAGVDNVFCTGGAVVVGCCCVAVVGCCFAVVGCCCVAVVGCCCCVAVVGCCCCVAVVGCCCVAVVSCCCFASRYFNNSSLANTFACSLSKSSCIF